MLIAITGTPGTGKTSVAEILEKKGYKIVDINNFAVDKKCILKKDKKRDSNVVDIKKLDSYIKDFKTDDIMFVEGHLSHLLSSVDKVFLLRCHPSRLKKNLNKKNWGKEKINENLEAEILDIILLETIDNHKESDIFEIDTTEKSVDEIADIIIEIIKNNFKNIKKYKLGNIDWSEEILKDF